MPRGLASGAAVFLEIEPRKALPAACAILSLAIGMHTMHRGHRSKNLESVQVNAVYFNAGNFANDYKTYRTGLRDSATSVAI
jgi:hypothetical protein